jgi:hypothetical protein
MNNIPAEVLTVGKLKRVLELLEDDRPVALRVHDELSVNFAKDAHVYSGPAYEHPIVIVST